MACFSLKYSALSLAIAGVFLLPACRQKAENPIEPLLRSRDKAQDAADAANLAALKTAVQAYQAANGYYPASLTDVESMLGGRIEPDDYDYDPQTGEVKLRGR